MADAEGADNCVAFLNRVKAHAEDKGVNICMELLTARSITRTTCSTTSPGAWR